MKPEVTGQAPISLERKINSGGKQMKCEENNTITEINRITQTKNMKVRFSVRTYQNTYHMPNESQQKPNPRRQHSTRKKKAG